MQYLEGNKYFAAASRRRWSLFLLYGTCVQSGDSELQAAHCPRVVDYGTRGFKDIRH
jgi:hypothetical protein